MWLCDICPLRSARTQRFGGQKKSTETEGKNLALPSPNNWFHLERKQKWGKNVSNTLAGEQVCWIVTIIERIKPMNYSPPGGREAAVCGFLCSSRKTAPKLTSARDCQLIRMGRMNPAKWHISLNCSTILNGPTVTDNICVHNHDETLPIQCPAEFACPASSTQKIAYYNWKRFR